MTLQWSVPIQTVFLCVCLCVTMSMCICVGGGSDVSKIYLLFHFTHPFNFCLDSWGSSSDCPLQWQTNLSCSLLFFPVLHGLSTWLNPLCKPPSSHNTHIFSLSHHWEFLICFIVFYCLLATEVQILPGISEWTIRTQAGNMASTDN